MVRICPSCGETYGGEVLTCTLDGSELEPWEAARSLGATVLEPGARRAAQATTVTTGHAAATAAPPPPSSSSSPSLDGAPPVGSLAPLESGRVLGGRYAIEAQIGVGGCGVVFGARDRRLDKRVALKVLSPHLAAKPTMLARFRLEALAASHIGHPAIVNVTDFDRAEDGTYFLVMEFLDGRDLSRVIAEEAPLSPLRALDLARQVADALAAAHERGIVHRDLKPANIYLVGRPDGEEQVKILDFGISKMMASSAEPEILTGVGQLLGTPYYISPEQARGEASLDGRTDVYALGVILYEMLAGRRPFVASSYLGVISLHLTAVVEPPSRIVGGGVIPLELDALVLRALEKSREARFGSMKELGAALEDVAGRLTSAALAAPLARALPPPVEADPTVVDAPAGPAAPALSSTWATRPSRVRRSVLLCALALAAAAALWGGRWVRRQGRPVGSAGGAAGSLSARRARPAGAPQPLTSLGGCAYGPAFVDARTLVFDLTRGDEVDLFSIPLAGGAPTRLTSGPAAEHAASAGRRPGELLYLATDPRAAARVGSTRLVFRDLASGREESRVVSTGAAVAAGGATYYARVDAAEIRRLAGLTDEVLAVMPPERPIGSLAASPGGRWLGALTDMQHGSPRLCLIDLAGLAGAPGATPPVRCLDEPRPLPGRVGFSSDESFVYYPTASGVRRFEIAGGRDELAVPEVYARGGVALSPDGRALVFSDCRPRGTLLDVTETPPHPALEEDLPREPCAGPGGRLAFVRDRRSRRVLVVREPSGVTREVTSEALGSPSAPAFDSAGKRLVFQLAEPGRSGIYVVDAEGQYPAEAVTRGEHDTDPIFARDGEIFFTRWDELHNPVVMRTRPGQPELRRALASPRQTVQLVRRSGEILLGSKDKKELFLWDPATGRERRVALGAAEGGYLMAAAVAPDGRFAVVQVGTYGRVLWKIWLDRSARPAERVFEAQLGQSMSSVTITEEGRILVAPRTWLGELHAVLAPAGEVF